MYTSKIGSDSFRLTVERFVSALSQYMPGTKISCDKGSSFDQFNRDRYTVKIKYKIKPRKYATAILTVSDDTCTCEDYDRGCNVYLIDECYWGIEHSWDLMLDCPGYTGNQVARYIQDIVA